MPPSPTVSVIIPTFNREHLIGRALKSVRAQTFTDWECLVVDDASTDNTGDVVRRFGDPRVRYLRHESNRQAGAARNTGISAALGQFLAFLDSDDEWMPTKLERQLDMFANTSLENLGLVFCGISMVKNGETYRTQIRPTVPDGWCYEAALAHQVTPHATSTWLMRRASFSHFPMFDEMLRSKQDWEYVVRASEQAQFAWVREPLIVSHKDGADRISVDGKYQMESLLYFIGKYEDELRKRPRLHRRYHHSIAMLYRRRGEIGKARRHLRLAVKASPLDPRGYGWLAIGSAGGTALDVVSRFRRRSPEKEE